MQQGKRFFLTLLAILGWLAVIAQLYLAVVNRQVTVPVIIIRFFSYFTILTNILTALCSTFLLLRPGRGFFSGASVQAAVTVYIAVVGLVYNVILRALWAPQGLQMFVDELLHSVVPVMFIIYWLVFAPKKALAWPQLPAWLLYPFTYLLYTLAHGVLSGFYPYPFLDVNQLGFAGVARNACGMLVLFLLLSAGVMATGKFLGKRRLRREPADILPD